MQTLTNHDGESQAQSEPTTHDQLSILMQRYPSYNFLPLLDLVTCNTPDEYEAFFNQVAELVCWNLQDEKWDNLYLMRIMHELFRFRDTFRGMRGGAGWNET